MVTKKECKICHEDSVNNISAFEKVIGNDLSTIIKRISGIEVRAKAFFCSECAAGIIQANSVLEKLRKAFAEADVSAERDLNAKKRKLAAVSTIEESGNDATTSSPKLEEADSKSAWLLKCDHCEYEASNVKVFKRHMLIKHQEENPVLYKCKQCPKSYQRLFYLQRHVEYDHENKPRPIQKRRVTISLDARNADDSVNGNQSDNHAEPSINPERLKCDHCNYESSNRKIFKRHLSSKHEVTDPYIYKCAYCSKSYQRLFPLQRHIDFDHENKSRPPPRKRVSMGADSENSPSISHKGTTLDPIHCDRDNDKNWKEKSSEISHIKIEDTEVDGLNNSSTIENVWQFNCHLCPYETEKPKRFKKHLLTQHHIDDSFIYKCKYCSDTYQRLFLLQNHIENQHNERRANNISNNCNRELSSLVTKTPKKEMLRYPDKKHSCVICGKGFVSIADLRSHVDKRHMGDELKICPNCGAQFYSQQKYDSHVFKEKCLDSIYSCQHPNCNKRFSKLSKMRKHMEKHADGNGTDFE